MVTIVEEFLYRVFDLRDHLCGFVSFDRVSDDEIPIFSPEFELVFIEAT